MAFKEIPHHRTIAVAKKVGYEFNMFRFLYQRLSNAYLNSAGFVPGDIQLTSGFEADDDELGISAWLESFLIHTRVLADFFCPCSVNGNTGQWDRKQHRHRNDDVHAIDFIPTWDHATVDIGSYLTTRDRYQRLNKALAHLSAERTKYDSSDKQWEIDKIFDPINKLIDDFKQDVDTSIKEWFK